MVTVPLQAYRFVTPSQEKAPVEDEMTMDLPSRRWFFSKYPDSLAIGIDLP